MKKVYYLLLLLISASASAQELKMYKTFGGAVFERDSVTLSFNQTMMLLKQNEAAYREMKLARTNYTLSGILGFSGGVLIGIPVGTAIAGGNPEWVLAGGGAVLILGSFHFLNSFRNRAWEAVEMYNGRKASRINTKFQFYGTGARLVIRF